jgi:poly-beta-1,6-N-acetyl-D-glucosamine synthase
MKLVFWGSVCVVGYTYVGYAAWLWLRARLRPRPVKRQAHLPSVSIAMVVRNEDNTLERKLRNLLVLNYPADRLEFVVVSDGSTDGTERILATHAAQDARFRVIASPISRGKAAGLNDAMQNARGEIVVFTDARQLIEPDAIRLLMENFADPEVGCVSGELMLGDPADGETGRGLGLYWRVEKKIREFEAASGSVVGATGALYAARRELLVAVPEETILDDVFLPMNVARRRARVVFDERARAWDSANLGERREFARKVRTLSGNYQLVRLAPWLLKSENPIRFEFISHKLMRLLVPFALAGMLVSSVVSDEAAFRVAALGQLAFYSLGGVAFARLRLGPLERIADAACTFVVLNAAALVAFMNFVTGRKAEWVPVGVPTPNQSRRRVQS